MKNIGLILTLTASLALSSCALFTKSAPPYPRGVVFPLSQAAALDYPGEIVGAPAFESGRLYFGTDKGLVCAVDLVHRVASWQFVAFGPLLCTPALSGTIVLAVDVEGRLVALDKSDGHPLWQTEVKHPDLAWMTAVQDRVILSGPSGLLVSLASSDGRELWRTQAPSALVVPPLVRNWGLPHILLFGQDGTVQFLTVEGKPGTRLRLKAPPCAEPLLDHNLIYYGGVDRRAYCFDLSSGKVRWRAGMPGTVTCTPTTFGRYLYLWTSHGALYCMDKSEGDILWWKSVASRLSFPQVVIEDKIIVSFSSPSIMSFDIRTGKESGTFDAGLELCGGPLWFDPALLVNGYDPIAEKGRLLFLQKEVSVDLKASKDSPQGTLDEIIFVAKPAGFFRPKFEFFLTGVEPEELVQKASDQNAWSWYPDKAGDYKVKVRVTDEKEKAEAEMPFTITAEPAKKEPAAGQPPGAKPPAKKAPAEKKAPSKK